MKSEQAIPFKKEMYELSLTYKKMAVDAGVKIVYNTPVTKALCEELKPDALIIATGSNPIIPPLEGIEKCVVVNDYYLNKDKVGNDVVVLGGGLAGCECAIHLGQAGKNVHLVEMRDVLAPDANVRHRPLLLNEIEKYVEVHTSYRGLRIIDDGVICLDSDNNEVLVPGRSVICALGQRSAPYFDLLDGAPFVRVIGDANRVSTITNAVYQGYHAALDI